MKTTAPFTAPLAVALAVAAPSALSSALGAPRVVASFPAADIDVPSTGATVTFDVNGLQSLVVGFGLSGLWTAPVADQGDGLFPWPLDFGVTVTTPGGQQGSSPSPWFGDISIADYPVADGFEGFGFGGDVLPDGTWTVDFDSGNPAPWVAGLRDVELHLLALGPDITFELTENTQQGNSWNRPFFIEGVSGLGPVDYHVLEFTVSESGLYSFESILANGREHWTCLYKDAFLDALPLVGLHEYGLGNGFDPFGAPRGTSAFEQLLFEGTTYYWVTSQWSRTAAFSDFTNTITGPGDVRPAGQGCSIADLVAPFGFVDLADADAFIGAFGDADPLADVAEPFGLVDLADVDAFIGAFMGGCP